MSTIYSSEPSCLNNEYQTHLLKKKILNYCQNIIPLFVTLSSQTCIQINLSFLSQTALRPKWVKLKTDNDHKCTMRKWSWGHIQIRQTQFSQHINTVSPGLPLSPSGITDCDCRNYQQTKKTQIRLHIMQSGSLLSAYALKIPFPKSNPSITVKEIEHE